MNQIKHTYFIKYGVFFLYLSIGTFFFTGVATAQLDSGLSGNLVRQPIQNVESTVLKKRADRSAGRIASDGTLPCPLPFWDDFSTGEGSPNLERWTASSRNVFISNGIGINAPSLGVASFDGAKYDGSLYAFSGGLGGTDTLTSQTISMGSLNPTEKGSVYLSFFVQRQGFGETPNENDSITVEIKDDTGLWTQIWGSRSYDAANASNPIPNNNFAYIELKIDDRSASNYFFDGFQFRFTAYGRQTGALDHWNIDYVFLNANRGDAGKRPNFPDKAITSPMTSIFEGYRSIPVAHFLENATTLSVAPQMEISNNSSEPNNVGGQTSAVLTTRRKDGTLSTQAIDIERDITADVLSSKERKALVASTAIDYSVLTTSPEDIDSVGIVYEFLFTSKDNEDASYDDAIHAPLDFNVNDTLRTPFTLSDYYAYDDGTAEFGAGTVVRNAQFSYAFVMQTNRTDTLVAVDMYFPNIGSEQSGQELELIIRDDNGGFPGEVLYSDFYQIEDSDALNEFKRYDIFPSLEVSGTFYIGWRQINEGRLVIGLDENTNSSDKVFSFSGGGWTSSDLSNGSLMIRPVFGNKKIITGLNDDAVALPNPYLSYPNPNKGILYVQQDFEEIRAFDLRGREVEARTERLSSKNHKIELVNAARGIYLLHFTDKKGQAYISKTFVVD